MSEIRNISDYKTMSDEELQSLYEKIRTGQQAPLSLGEVGIGGRLVSGFADTPQGKQKLLDRFGIEGSLRDPLGSGRADVFGAPSFSEGLNRFGDKLYEGARDAARSFLAVFALRTQRPREVSYSGQVAIRAHRPIYSGCP